MPIHLNAPLAWTKANADELKLLQALQGNILKGHGRAHTANIFFKLDPAQPVLARRALRNLANFHLTSAHQQLVRTQAFKDHGVSGGGFAHLALTAKGYQALGAAAAAPADADFQGGMRSAASVGALADPPVDQWESPFQEEIHGLLLAAEEGPAELGSLTGKLLDILADAGATVLLIQRGTALRNSAGEGIENFGYVDGRSQPLLLAEDIHDENIKAGSVNWDPAFPLSTALVKDPGVPASDNVSFGSFLVFRKLEQDVRGFKAREQALADSLGLTGDKRELAGALVVGRFEDGTPVTRAYEPQGGFPLNDFDYTGDAGQRCPFHAHIRKSNPRGSGSSHSGGNPEPAERLHLMPRRGIPYEDVKRPVHPDELPEADTTAEFNAKVAPLLPTGGVGLLFMAYNHSIAQQFKFTQQSWVNASSFPAQPGGPHGIDPVIGQGANAPGEQKYRQVWDDAGSAIVNNSPFAGFVKMRGGEYFFSPSLSFLRAL